MPLQEGASRGCFFAVPASPGLPLESLASGKTARIQPSLGSDHYWCPR